jgi:hypothetical protein
VLNIGADVAKDAIVVACSEGSFSAHEIANQHTALLAFLKPIFYSSFCKLQVFQVVVRVAGA